MSRSFFVSAVLHHATTAGWVGAIAGGVAASEWPGQHTQGRVLLQQTELHQSPQLSRSLLHSLKVHCRPVTLLLSPSPTQLRANKWNIRQFCSSKAR